MEHNERINMLQRNDLLNIINHQYERINDEIENSRNGSIQFILERVRDSMSREIKAVCKEQEWIVPQDCNNCKIFKCPYGKALYVEKNKKNN